MNSSAISPIEAINAAIQSYNPFINAGIVKEQDVWGKGFPDVPNLNSHASDAVFQAIDLVRNSTSSQDKVTSIAITASQGVGKTHILSRIRHRLEREGGALFVYASVNNYYEEPLPKDPLERFELALKRESEANIGDYLEDNSLIAEAIYFGFETLKNQTLEGVIIEDITSDIKPKKQKKEFINFKIIGSENGKEVKISVAVIQSSQFTLTAGLKRLTEYETYDITRGCLVRSKSKVEQIKKNSEAYKLLNQLISEKGGEHVDLIEEQIRPLISLRAVCKNCGNYKLTEEQVFDFISQKQLTFENPLLREILSNPSGEMPNIDEEDDIQVIEEFLNTSIIEGIDDADDLDDLFN